MPSEPEWIPNDRVLSFEQIARVARILSDYGVDRIRLSGGEPLVRNKIENLVRMLRANQKITRIGITTNGFYLSGKALVLKEAGLDSVTVSLHSLKAPRFAFVTQTDAYDRVMEGIGAAKNAGFEQVKINAVIIRGYNDDEILDFASMAFEGGYNVRFIEFMPFDGKKMWGLEKVVSGEEILSKIRKSYEILKLEREKGSTATNYKFKDGDGEFGIITSISKPFCSDCDRLRLTADGKLVPCLFDAHEYDVGKLLRDETVDDSQIAGFLKNSMKLKAAGVESLVKQNKTLEHVRPMYITGG